MPIILYGVRGYTLPTGSGDFFCPGCTESTNYRKKLSFAAVHLYFIPLIPFKWNSYVECGACMGTYEPAVLDWDPRNDPAVRSAANATMLQTMAMMMIADGDIDEREISVIQEIYRQMAGQDLSRDELVAEAHRHGGSEASLTHALAQVRTTMNAAGREKVLEAAIRVAMADDVLTDEEAALLDRIGHTLMIPRQRSAAIWEQVEGQRRMLPG